MFPVSITRRHPTTNSPLHFVKALLKKYQPVAHEGETLYRLLQVSNDKLALEKFAYTSADGLRLWIVSIRSQSLKRKIWNYEIFYQFHYRKMPIM